MFPVDALPREKKTIKIVNRYRLNLRAQAIDGEPVNSRQQSTITPFLIGRLRMKFAAQNKAFGLEREQRGVDFRALQNQCICQLSDRNWSTNFHAPANQLANRVSAFPSFSADRFGQHQFVLSCRVAINRPEHWNSFCSDVKKFIANLKSRCSVGGNEFFK